MKLEALITQILDEMESTSSYVEPESDTPEDDEEIDEINANATTGDMSYNTPGAFRKTDGEEDDETSGFNNGHKDPEVLGYKKMKVSKRNFESEFKKMAKGMFLTEGTKEIEFAKNRSAKQKLNETNEKLFNKMLDAGPQG